MSKRILDGVSVVVVVSVSADALVVPDLSLSRGDDLCHPL